MRNKIIIGVVALVIGAFIGLKVTEYLGREYIMNNIPIPEGTLDDKDAYIESVPADSVLMPKVLASVERKAKNIILLIGDGMSLSQVSAYRLIKGGPNSRITVDRFPYSGIVLTHAENAVITDSASSATAYSTGRKTNNGALGMDSENNELENLTETLDQYGFVSSLLATSEVTHATPAAFASHVDLRWKTDEISTQMMQSKVATFLGGGRHFFLPEEMDGKRKDERNLLEEVSASHTLLTTKDEMNDFNDDKLGKVFGLFADEHLRSVDSPDNHPSEPSLSEMLQFAVKRSNQFIDNGCKGFFIMGEGSQVDWAGHSNSLEYLKREMQHFSF
jgi:alkaline phosphatase